MSVAAHPRGIDHVGLTVPDLESASHFLEEALGAIPLYDVQALDAPPMAGAEAEMQLGLPSGAKIVHMRLLRVGEGPSLELFQFADASQRGAAALPDYGLQHFALYVDDIDEAAARLKRPAASCCLRQTRLSALRQRRAIAGCMDGLPGVA